MKFNEKLLELRKQKGLSQEELSYKLNVARQTISKWESGITTPDFDNLIKLSKIFEISIDEFVGNDFVKTDENKKEEKENKIENATKNEKNKVLKIIYSIWICILIFITIVFSITIFVRYKIIDNIAQRLVYTYNSKENKVNEYMFSKNYIVLENSLSKKWSIEEVYCKGNIFKKEYYDTISVNNNLNNNGTELIRIEYRDENYYYDIDVINKTYRRGAYEKTSDEFYYFSSIELDVKITSKYNLDKSNFEGLKNKLSIALNFDNEIMFDIGKKDNTYTIRNNWNNGEGKDMLSISVTDSKENASNPSITVTEFIYDKNNKTNFESTSYYWSAEKITDEQIAFPDLSGYTIIEE